VSCRWVLRVLDMHHFFNWARFTCGSL
jgi:hypothetical protein